MALKVLAVRWFDNERKERLTHRGRIRKTYMSNMTKRLYSERKDISYKLSNIENYEVLEKHDVQLNFH